MQGIYGTYRYHYTPLEYKILHTYYYYENTYKCNIKMNYNYK